MKFLLKYPVHFPFLFFRIWLSCIFLAILQVAGAQEILVAPYLQPGNAPDLDKEEKVIIWQTDDVVGNFKVEFSEGASFSENKEAKINSVRLNFPGASSKLYRARLKNLKFDSSYFYRVSLNNLILAEHSFNTRSRTSRTRFAVFADVGAGSDAQAAIAYRVWLQEPQFVLIPGDVAYNSGRAAEYRYRFFPYYISPVASPEKGAPLLQGIPFYMMLGNHDVYSYDLDEFPDGLAYFYYSDLPRNAPVVKGVIVPEGEIKNIKEFERNASPQYPGISNYSFKTGNVHVTVLDGNSYVNPLDPKLVEWIRQDLGKSEADWKIVAYHQAAFSAGPDHAGYQLMRLLSPLLEEVGVDVVFSGHEHNYQRSLPLKFKPAVNESGTQYLVSEEGSVEGAFEYDTGFDGKTNTVAKGIIYIITGAGGGTLYGPELTDHPEFWEKETSESLEHYTAKLVSDRHSFTLIETNGKELVLKQIDAEGNVFDQIKISKK